MTCELSADADQRLRFALLGPLQAWRGEADLELGPVREQAVLAALLLRAGRTVSRRQLLDDVWGSEPPASGDRVVPVYVYRLRRRLDARHEEVSTPRSTDPADSVIDSVRGGYRFAPGNACLDVARWEERAAEGRSAREAGDLDAAVGVWSTALGLFRGEPLAGIPGPFAEGERLRLAEHRLLVVQDKADCQLRLGRHAEVVAELFSLTATHPHNEALAALLMRALHAGNRQADALDVYAATRRRLVDAQGVEPGAELRRVHEAVLRGDASGPRQPGLATRPKRRARHELPVEIGDFTGRERELDLLVAPAAARGVTVRVVDGMAGVGKTALAVRAARTLRDEYPDGCLFVELHGNRESRDGRENRESRERREAAGPHRVLRRLLRAVGASEGEDSEDLDELAASWRAATASLRLLLVLDDAARAEQVRPLLPAGSGSMVLVTSRRRLTGLDADRRLSLTPLGMEDAAGLLARIVGGTSGGEDARDARDAREAEREDAAVRRLAALCDRLPLALRIVGARIQDRPLWAVEALVAQLADDERRLDALAAEDRSVEVAFQVSYDQLPAAEQRAFRALGLSPTVRLDRLTLAALLGGTPGEAGRALESLADASLVQRVAAERYRLHDLVAVYARRIATTSRTTAPPDAASPDMTSPADATAARSGVFGLYVAAAHSASDWGNPALRTGPQGTRPFADWEEATNWLDAAGGELVDVVGQAAATGHLDDACRIAEGLVDYLTRQGRFHECRTALELLVPLVDGAGDDGAGVDGGGDDRAGDLRAAAALRTGLGIMYGLQGRYAPARTWFTEALDISRRAGDPHEQARASAGLGTFANLAGQIAESMSHFAEVISLSGELAHDDWLVGSIMTRAGDVHHQLGEHDKANARYLEAIALAERNGSPRLLGKTLLRLGGLQLDLGRPAEAAGTLGKAEDLARRLGDVPLYSAVLGRLAEAEVKLGNPQAAAELRCRSRALLDEETGTESEIAIRHRMLWQGAVAEDRSGSRDFFERATGLPAAEANRARISRALDGLGGFGGGEPRRP
ncbi:winged helix-turn-helix domain-containing protein [Streptacidiphilus sp. NEAU-YB345]|uniref:Winged helix-turn-helix domain-containing protein n=2 Tax=Streptacidiphilus fuscans TaxID=2789292 RepID=A0A931B284_9ACTN|nr:winged helix-turn-helix domain-containing protein [Streptacidiphilus fuscans]